MKTIKTWSILVFILPEQLAYKMAVSMRHILKQLILRVMRGMFQIHINAGDVIDAKFGGGDQIYAVQNIKSFTPPSLICNIF